MLIASQSSVEMQLADAPGVLAGVPDRADDRAGVLVVEHEELAHEAGGHLVVTLGEGVLEVQHRQQVVPRARRPPRAATRAGRGR